MSHYIVNEITCTKQFSKKVSWSKLCFILTFTNSKIEIFHRSMRRFIIILYHRISKPRYIICDNIYNHGTIVKAPKEKLQY